MLTGSQGLNPEAHLPLTGFSLQLFFSLQLRSHMWEDN